MNFLSAALFVSLSASCCYSEPTDETTWIDIGTDTIYSIERSIATWDEASEKCKLKGINGRLANIDSYIISNRLQKYVTFSQKWLWIGMRKNGAGDFVRTGNTESYYFNWEYPKRTTSRLDCVAIIKWNMKWVDANCTSKMYYLCAADRVSMASGRTAKDSHSKTDWIYKDTLYQLETETADWHEAVGNCMTRGKNGRLATIDSESTLNNIPDSVKYVWGSFWIGIYRNPEGEFQRVGSKQSNFFKWGAHEPNNEYGVEDCVQVLTPFLEFNDVPCSIKMNYICASDNGTITDPVSSLYTESLTLTDVIKECHAVVVANSFFIVLVVLIFLVVLVLKRWPLIPQIQSLDTKYLIARNADDDA